jgi:arylsulfatase A-like enzyme
MRPSTSMSLHCVRLLALLMASLVFTQWVTAAERPNIILLMGDDHGWDETGYNGHPHLKTPVLDQMAASGLRLDRFFSGHPSCSPTRVSVLTGRHPNRCGTFAPNFSIRPEEISVAAILKRAGYATAHFGKWHLGPVKKDSPTSPGAMGFDSWLSHDNFFELDPVLSRNGAAPKKIEGEGSEILISETVGFIRRASAEKKPFFAVVWFGSPHEPYSGLDKDLALYRDVRKAYPNKTVRLTSNKTGRPTTRPLGEVLQERYAEITAMDRSIGQLRDWLKEAGLRKNTLLWYCGDNGTPAGGIVTSPLRGRKGTMYDGGIRVPGVIEWPAAISKPRVSDVNSVTSDILPTLCEIIGRPFEKESKRPIDGISLVPLIEGKMTKRDKPIGFWSFNQANIVRARPYIASELQKGTTPLVKMLGGRYTRNFTNYHHPKIREQDFGGARVLLERRYKLIVRSRKGKPDTSELYDVRKDPAEKQNLLASEPAVVRSMQRKLRAWQQSVLESLTGADYR